MFWWAIKVEARRSGKLALAILKPEAILYTPMRVAKIKDCAAGLKTWEARAMR